MNARVVDRERLRQALDSNGVDDVEIRDDYSGRAMYGDECFGVVCDASTFALFCAAVGSSLDDWDWLAGVRSDSMGRSTIYYWPGVRLGEDEGAL